LRFPLLNFINFEVFSTLFRNWFLTFSVGFFFYYRDMPWWVYLGIGLGFILQSQIAIEGISWMSGWLPPISSIIVLLFLRFRKFRLPFIFALTAVILMLWQPVFGPIIEQEIAGGTKYRSELWADTLRIASYSPLFGLGPTNYYHYYRSQNMYGYKVYDPKLNSHNNYLDVYAQMGAVGLTLFLLLLGMIGWVCYKNTSKNQSTFRRFYFNSTLAALFGTMASMMAGDWLIPFVYNVGVRSLAQSIYAWYFLGGALALSKMPISEDEETGAGNQTKEESIEGENFRVFVMKR
jgi:O-antigen ligase